MKLLAKTYRLPPDLSPQSLLDQLADRFTCDVLPEKTERLVCCDSFDWRLYRGKVLLLREGKHWRLSEPTDLKPLLRLDLPTGSVPRFWWDFPVSSLQEKLRPLLDVRALLPWLQMEMRLQGVKILNADRKTVLSCTLKELRIISGRMGLPPLHFLLLEPIRGYSLECAELIGYIEELGLVCEEQSLFDRVVGLAGLTPGGYSTKIRLALEPGMAAGRAAAAIFQSQLAVIGQNEQGIIEDLDSEFLHDFRVAVRRTRAGLGQIKGVFQEKRLAHFKVFFAGLGESTNLLRDMDVAQLKEDWYRELLPESLRPGLGPLFSFFREERQRGRRKVLGLLAGPDYRRGLQEWQAFLADFDPTGAEAGAKAGKPLIKLADRLILRALAQVRQQGEGINDSSPDRQIHRLRIAFKKLRYLMEFFAGLFPARKMEILIKQSKRLQENLGNFNDLCVHEAMIKNYLEHHLAKGRKSLDTAAAVGGLLARLHQDRLRVRQAFQQSFAEFNQTENIALFEEICSSPQVESYVRDREKTG